MNLQLVPILGSRSCQHNQLLMVPQAKLVVFFVPLKKKKKNLKQKPQTAPLRTSIIHMHRIPRVCHQKDSVLTPTTAWWQLQASRLFRTPWWCPPQPAPSWLRLAPSLGWVCPLFPVLVLCGRILQGRAVRAGPPSNLQ